MHQKAIEKEFQGGSDDEDDLFAIREKSNDEKQAEEDDYKNWLLSQLKSETNCQQAFKDWLDFQEKKKSELEVNDRFLME